MTTAELTKRLIESRKAFDTKVAAIPRKRFEDAPLGRAHSPKQIVAHVTAYEELIVLRLKAAREGATTEFDRDRVGWEAFNRRVWGEARQAAWAEVLERSREVFAELLEQVAQLTDAELNGVTGIVEHIDSAWLEGRSLAELIAIDAYDHYPMHISELDEAASALD